MPQAAYDARKPNGSGRRAPEDRVIYVFRLYRKVGTPDVSSAAPANSPLASLTNPIRGAINTARNFLQNDVLGALQGKVLEKEYRFVLILERFQEVPEIRTHFQYLRKGYFLDTPFQNARGLTTFRISGRTHWNAVYVNGVAVDGDAAVKDLKELVDDYFYPRDGRSAADFELYWLNLNAPISAEDPFGEAEWLIHPLRNGVRTHQTAQRPFTRFFDFEFSGLQSNRDKAKADDGFLDSLLGRGFLATLLNKLGLGGVASALQDVFGLVRDVQGLLDDVANVVTAVTDYVTGVQQLIQASIAQVRGLMTRLQTIIGRVEDGIDLVKQLPDLAGDDLKRLQRDFPGLAHDETPAPGIIAADELRRVRDFLAALAMQPQAFATPVAGYVSPQTVALSITPGATIEDIAQRAGTDPDTLVTLNSLRWPFVDSRPHPEKLRAAAEAERDRLTLLLTSSPGSQPPRLPDARDALIQQGKTSSDPDVASIDHQIAVLTRRLEALNAEIAASADAAVSGVLYAGDTIRVPQPRPSVPPSLVEITPELSARILVLTGTAVAEEDRLFGLDLLLDSDGNLEWDTDKRELRLERGLDHMARVQLRYVKLPIGQLRYAPAIGNFAWADLARWQGPGTNQLLAFDLYKTLQQDVRIKSISSMRAETYAGTATLTYAVELVNGVAVPELRTPIQ